ncbi:hypothetical protein JTB14_032170 [Gonioctena quinquepunctata]|nr:hypothetical protein JTB14_032170 [Gonioctena quinquepunctata]
MEKGDLAKRGSNISVFCHQEDASGLNGSSADDLTQTETSQPRSSTKTAQTRDQLDILHLNVQCLNNKIDDLSVFLAENPFHVLCLSEIWLTSEQIQSTGIGNYTLASFFCRKKFKHGGVAIYVTNNVTPLVINVEKFCTEIAAEFTAIKVENTVIVTIYRSTNGDLEHFLNSLENMLEFLRKKHTNIVLIGDFNVNFLVDSKEKQKLENTLTSFNFDALLSEPTRVSDRSATCIDNVCVNFKGYKKFGIIREYISDHYAQYISLAVSNMSENKMPKEIRPITEMGIAEFKHYMNKIDWSNYLASDNPDFLTKFICENIKYAIELSFPLKHMKQNGHKPEWFNEELKSMRQTVNQNKINYRNTGDLQLKSKFHITQKIYREKVKKTKRAMYDNILANSKNKAKTAWRVVNEIQGTDSFLELQYELSSIGERFTASCLNNRLIVNAEETVLIQLFECGL